MDVAAFINQHAGQETIVYVGLGPTVTKLVGTLTTDDGSLPRTGVPTYSNWGRIVLYNLVRHINSIPDIVELGVREGLSTTAFAAALGDKSPGFLTSYDPEWHEELFKRHLMTDCEWKYYEVTGEEGYALHGDVGGHRTYIDLLYIDTDPHDYNQTKAFLHNYWIQNVRHGSYIVLDDCSPYFQRGMDVAKVPKMIGDFKVMNAGEWGVLQAILEFVEENADKLDYAFSVWNHSSPGTAIIKLKEGVAGHELMAIQTPI